MYLKTIIQGRLEFGTEKSYEKVTKMFLQRLETYYKTDVFFKYEDIFKDETLSMEIPRFVGQVTDKAFRVTMGLLGYSTQFAIAGSIRGWLIDEGHVVNFVTLEPDSDKGAVQSFVKGRDLVKIKGKESEALDALSNAIEKYNRHAQAYERRAKVNFFMRNYHDAIRDYNKCIGIDPSIPTAFYGKAKVHIIREEWQEAIENLEESIKKSIALQTLYWKSRKLKAECHLQLKEWTKAAFDLKLFSNRKFSQEDPNHFWRRWAFYNYAWVLTELNEPLEAIKNYDKALQCPDIKDGVQTSDILYYRGLTKEKAGKTGGKKDIKDAADLNNKKAIGYLINLKKK